MTLLDEHVVCHEKTFNANTDGFCLKRMMKDYGYIRDLPAIDAVMNVTQLPAINARKATAVISCRREGSSELIAPIMIPMEDGLANPHKANVAIPELLSCFRRV